MVRTSNDIVGPTINIVRPSIDIVGQSINIVGPRIDILGYSHNINIVGPSVYSKTKY